MTMIAREDGVAMLVAMMALLLLSALGVALILTYSSDTMIAAHFRDSLEARYAAGALLERGMDDIAIAADWTLLSGGVAQSAWVDGPPSGPRALSDGSTIDLAQAVNLANCKKTTACSAADLSAVTAERPWGASNPQWTAFAYGALRDVLPAPGAIDSPYYVLLMVGAAVAMPGWDVLAVRSEAFGPRGAHAVVEATAGRPRDVDGDETGYNQSVEQSTVTILSWREVR
jgi:Tfp pilus assembly protein PilX